MTTTSAPDLARAAQLFHALSDETRLGILSMLGEGERCVCELQDAFNAAQSRLSYHLKILKTAGLVSDRVEGRWSYYTVNAESIAAVHDTIGELAKRPVTSANSISNPAKRTLPLAPTSGGGCCS